MTHVMYFANPVFNKGCNITVRMGDDWMKAMVGDTLLLRKNGEIVTLSIGVVIGRAHITFSLFPESWLQYAHDPDCRTRKTLLNKMLKFYPDFKPYDWVTIILFSV